MSRDSVRYGRVPKRSRERTSTGSSEVTSNSSDNGVSSPETANSSSALPVPLVSGELSPNNHDSPNSVESKQLALYDVILTISQAHHAHCSYTEEKTKGLVRKPLIMALMDVDASSLEDGENDGTGSASPGSSSMATEALEANKIAIWQQFAVLTTPSIQKVVEFAKRIPGFLDLTQDDQLILIKVGFFEVWLVHISRMVSMDSLTFADGSYMTRNQLEVMFDYDFVSGIFNFMLSFNSFNLNDTEIGLFAAAVLLQSGMI